MNDHQSRPHSPSEAGPTTRPMEFVSQRVPASAPVKAVDQEGESSFQVNVTNLKTESNCVLARGGGEQLEVNDQSVT